MKKRFLPLLLALSFLFVLLPQAAQAASYVELVPPKYTPALWPMLFSEGMANVHTGGGFGGRYGFIDKTGKEVIPLKYEYAMQFEDGLAMVQANGKIGFIDHSGNEVIPLKYDNIESFSNGFAQVMLNRKYGFIDKQGNEIVPLKYDMTDRYVSDDMCAVSYGGKLGYVDTTTGNEVISPKYDFANRFTDGVAVVNIGGQKNTRGDVKGGQWYIIDKTGKEIAVLEYDTVWDYSDGMAQVVLNNRLGYIDQSGREVISPQYDVAGDFSNGIANVTLNGKEGCIDRSGRALKYDYVSYFTEGVARVRLNEKYGFISAAGEEIVSPQYDQVENFSDGLAVITKNGKQGFVDQNGKEVVSPKYDKVNRFINGYSIVWLNGKQGFISRTGEEVISPRYDDVLSYSDGSFWVMVDGKWGSLTKSGQEIISPKYDRVAPLSNGLVGVNVGATAYAKLADKHFGVIGGKWGIIDQAGNEVVPIIYDAIKATKYPDLVNINIGGYMQGSGVYGGQWGVIALVVDPEAAVPAASKVLINEKQTAFDAYTINQNNYFKLRDIATALSGTSKQFDVTWDGGRSAINLISGKPYTSVGGEMAVSGSTAKEGKLNTAIIFLDGKEITMTSYTIGGNNYFKLRDLGELFDFGVGWDGAANTVSVDASKSYTP